MTFDEYLKVRDILKIKNLYIGEIPPYNDFEIEGLITLSDEEIESVRHKTFRDNIQVHILAEDDIMDLHSWIPLQSTTGILEFSKEFIDKKKVYQNFEEIINETK